MHNPSPPTCVMAGLDPAAYRLGVKGLAGSMRSFWEAAAFRMAMAFRMTAVSAPMPKRQGTGQAGLRAIPRGRFIQWIDLSGGGHEVYEWHGSAD